ncbi:CyP450 monooxygenase [Daedaleopsis nitida]|nr:CyP450 monooxygenase [Daedaleopsis nitida]
MIVLGTLETAMDLLEKRSGNYSDRPFSVMSSLTGWTWLFSVLPYGPQWRRARRLMSEHMNSHGAMKFRPVQQLYARRYLLRVLDSPEDFLHHGRYLFGSAIIRAGYGIDVDNSDVDYLGIAQEAMHKFSIAFYPGKFIVETFTSLRHLPSFLPGAEFKRWAAKSYPAVRRMRDVPWDAAVEIAGKGRLPYSMASELLGRISTLDDADAAAEAEEYSKNAVGAALAGGADTTLSTLQSFYLAMVLYPEVQARAQAELETVIGPHRLPTFADAQELPYISAVVKESLRWRLVTPMGMMHGTIGEDEYRGYRIPAGSAVINNLWAYAHDPKIYPDPDSFKPERFLKDDQLDPEVTDPSSIVFGFGRRYVAVTKNVYCIAL